jgi:inorganic triphosphatase YgiF
LGEEIEIKFYVPADSIDAANRFFEGADSRELRTRYYDTPTFALRAAGIDWRIREDGNRLTQTLKISGNGRSAFSRAEHETELEEPRPDWDHARALLPAEAWRAVFRDGLHNRFTTRVTRRRKLILSNASKSAVEAVFDTGEIEANGSYLPLNEIEFELQTGGVGDLSEACRAFQREVPSGLSVSGKSSRGFWLATGGGPAPAFADIPALSVDANVHDAAQVCLRQGLAQALGNIPAVVRSRDAEGVHQMRVGVRRLRSTIKTFKPALDISGAAAQLDEVAALFRKLGEVRDLDVFAGEALPSLNSGIVSDGTRDRLAFQAMKLREALLGDIAAYLRSPEFARLAIDLNEWIESRNWISPPGEDDAATPQKIGIFARERLKTVHSAFVKRAKKARSGDVADWHEARKAAKKLRYASEPLFAVTGIDATAQKKYLTRLKRMQDELGSLNDAEMVGSVVRQVMASIPAKERKKLGGVDGRIARWSAKRKRTLIGKATKRFKTFRKHGFPR